MRYLKIGPRGDTVTASCYRSRSGASSKRISIDIVPGRLIRLSESGFTVRVAVPKLDTLGVEFNYVLNRLPYQENGRWSVQIDDVVWLKREDGEDDPLATWSCPE